MDNLTCLTCLKDKPKEKFYKSRSPLFISGYAPYCKDCLMKVDVSSSDKIIPILKQLDVPYSKTLWDNVSTKYDNRQIGNYLRIIALQMPNERFEDSEIFKKNIKELEKINKQIDKSNKELNKLEKEILKKEEEDKKLQEVLDNIEIEKQKKLEKDNEMIELQNKWGTELPITDCLTLERKYKELCNSIPNADNPLQFEAIKIYLRYSLRAEQAVAKDDPDSAKKWGDLAQKSAKQAKLTPEQLSLADLNSGVQSITEIIAKVEEAIDFIPPPVDYINKAKDKADMVLWDLINYNRKINDLHPVDYSEIYDFINNHTDERIKNFKSKYSYLDNLGVDGNTHLERYHNYIFQVVIPQLKKEFPTDPFYQHLEKWTKFASFYRWYPDLFFDFIAPLDKKGRRKQSKFSIEQRLVLRSFYRFQEVHCVLPRGSGKCIVGDSLIFTDNGIKEIGSLLDYKKDNVEFIKNGNVNILNKDGVLEKSPRSIYTGYKPTKKITLKYGYEIEATLNHKLFVYENENFEWKESESLKINNNLCLNIKNNLFGKNSKINFNAIDFYKKNIKTGKMYFFPTFLDESLSELVGIFVGIGTMNEKYICLETENSQMRTYSLKKIKDNLNLDYLIKDNSTVINFEYLKDYLLKLDLKYWEDDKKETPKIILETNRKNVISFLQGYINSIAYIEDNKLCLNIAGEKLSKQIQILLLNFGIISNREYKDNYYKISIFDGYLKLLLKTIKIINVKLNNQLNDCLIKDDLLNVDNYVYLPIEKIEDSINHCYDVYMPKTNSFIANGIVNHNTYIGVLSSMFYPIFYPNGNCSIVSTTKAGACNLLSSKFNEILDHYPLLKNEFLAVKQGSIESKNEVKYVSKFSRNSYIDTMLIAQSTKGSRRDRIVIEESAQINHTLFKDVIKPTTSRPRVTQGDLDLASPYEVHNNLIFNTTSWFRVGAEFERVKSMYQDMIDLKGVLVIGGSFEINLIAERNESRVELMRLKEEDPIMFALNYGGDWLGVVDGAIVNLENLIELRQLELPEFKRTEGSHEYFISVDVARSMKDSNNQSSICVFKVDLRPDKSINTISLVNIMNFKGTDSFKFLARQIKKLNLEYNPTEIVIDSNGLGIGLIERLAENNIEDEKDGLIPLCPNNKVLTSADENAVPKVNAFVSSNKNTDIIINFQKYIENKKLKLLKKVTVNIVNNNEILEENMVAEQMPFLETDFLINEISNLKLSQSDKKVLSVQKVSGKMDKDRFSALSYGLYAIDRYFETPTKNIEQKEKKWVFFN